MCGSSELSCPVDEANCSQEEAALVVLDLKTQGQLQSSLLISWSWGGQQAEATQHLRSVNDTAVCPCAQQ